MTQEENLILEQIEILRAANKGVYVAMDSLFNAGDKTMELIKKMYAFDPEKAKEWHRRVLENDAKILELTRELCK